MPGVHEFPGSRIFHHDYPGIVELWCHIAHQKNGFNNITILLYLIERDCHGGKIFMA